jgi:hypothetical protein
MVEAVIAAALVLIPLFLAIPVIAKYMDIRTQVVQGARYAAWERTVWFGGAAAAPVGFGASVSNTWYANEKTDDVIRTEIGARILARNGGAFNTTTDQASSGALAASGMWQDRRGTPMLQNYNAIADQNDNNEPPGIVNTLLGPLMDIAALVSSFTLDTHAQYTANVSLTVQEVAFNNDNSLATANAMAKQRYDNDFLVTGSTMNFSEKNAIIANGWNANGPGSFDDLKKEDNGSADKKTSVYRQVRGLTPTSIFQPTNGVANALMDVLNGVMLVFLPELSTLQLGKIDVDQVPADRTQ